MSKSIQMKNKNNEKMYPHPYYPIGSIYLSVNNTNPSKWFGGTWELIAQGRTLVGVDINDTDFNKSKIIGGSKSITLTVEQIPSHSHAFRVVRDVANTDSTGSYPKANNGQGNNYGWSDFVSTTIENAIQNTGGGKAHNNLPPYFTCYIWCRTA